MMCVLAYVRTYVRMYVLTYVCMYVSVTLRNVAVTSCRNVASMMRIRTPSIIIIELHTEMNTKLMTDHIGNYK